MKNLLVILLTVFAFSTNAQMHTFKTDDYTFIDATKAERTITGIKAKMINNIDCNLSDSTFFRSFYIVFQLATGAEFGETNSDTDKFVKQLITKGYTQEQAKTAVKNICNSLEYGTKPQKYEAAKSLALGYGYILLPISQQE
jgi:hypothetical protein